MMVLKMLKEPKYLGLVFGLSFLMLFLYPALQVLPQGGLNNFWFWFSLLSPPEWILYLLYGIFFGLTFSFFIFSRRQKTCPLPKRFGSGTSGALGTFLGIILPQCPACFSLAAVFLPFSVFTFFATHTAEIMLASVILLAGSLWMLGAFNKITK